MEEILIELIRELTRFRHELQRTNDIMAAALAEQAALGEEDGN